MACSAPVQSPHTLCPLCYKELVWLPRESPDQLMYETEYPYGTTYSVFAYDGVLQELIQRLKFRDQSDIALLMQKWLAQHDWLIAPVDAILPIPLAMNRMRKRHYNQALLLAKPLAKTYDKPLLIETIIRKNNSVQSILKKQARKLNMAGAFHVKKPDTIQGKNLLLIDDVITTGATVIEAAKTLIAAGAHRVDVMSLAKTRYEQKQ
jgi:ComF family protein